MIVVAPTHKAALVIAMITLIATTSQPIMITEAKIIMPSLESNQGPILVAHKTLLTITVIIFMIINRVGDKTANPPQFLLKEGMLNTPLELNHLRSR